MLFEAGELALRAPSWGKGGEGGGGWREEWEEVDFGTMGWEEGEKVGIRTYGEGEEAKAEDDANVADEREDPHGGACVGSGIFSWER